MQMYSRENLQRRISEGKGLRATSRISQGPNQSNAFADKRMMSNTKSANLNLENQNKPKLIKHTRNQSERIQRLQEKYNKERELQ